MTCRIATVQAEARPADVAHNVRRAAEFADRAARAGASVMVFPEAFVTGYDADAFTGPLPTLEDLRWLAPVQKVVDDAGLVAVVNTALDRGDRRTLTDVVLAPHRVPVAAYDKQHLHAPERDVFTAGDGGCSFDVGDTRIALSVCCDANFPEHAASAAASGATVYVNSGAYFPGGERRRDLHYAARALDNGVYVVFSGLVGAPHDFIGGSGVFDPLGRLVARVDEREGIAVVDIDPDIIAATRDEQRMWRDRRDTLGPHRHLDALVG